jgi:hypothetical protein
MSLIDELYQRVVETITPVNVAITLAQEAVTAAQTVYAGLTTQGGDFGGSGGFGGGGASGVNEVSTSVTPSPSIVSNVYNIVQNPVDLPQVVQVTQVDAYDAIFQKMMQGNYQSAFDFTVIIKNMLSQVLQPLTDEVNNTWQYLVKIKDDVMSSIDAAFTATYSTIESYLKGVVETISEGIDSLKDEAITTYNIIQQYLKGALADVTTTVQQVEADIQLAVTEMGLKITSLIDMLAIFKDPDTFGVFLMHSLMVAWNTEV